MGYIKLLLTSLFFLFSGCGKECEFEFCFCTVVNGRVYVTETQIGKCSPPCGFLSSHGGKLSNEEYDFTKLKDRDLCGKSACCYHMEPPDSAFLGWGSEFDGESYDKRIKLPPYPKLKFGERYRISFSIAYKDCVYCKIEAVD